MRISYNRRTATKVKDGRVQRKNRHIPTGRLGYVLDRESPGRGFRHVLSKRDLQAFIDLIPNWDQLSQNLERIVLADQHPGDAAYGFYHREETRAIFFYAWHQDLRTERTPAYLQAHADIFDRIGL